MFLFKERDIEPDKQPLSRQISPAFVSLSLCIHAVSLPPSLAFLSWRDSRDLDLLDCTIHTY